VDVAEGGGPPAPGGPPARRRPDARRRPRAGAALAAVAAALVLLAGVALALVVSPGARDTAAPATPTPRSAPTPEPDPRPTPEPTPRATTTPTPVPDDETPAPLEGARPLHIDEIAAQVAALRGLPLDEPLDARVVAPAALSEHFAAIAVADLEPDVLEADRRLLVALGLLAPADDLLGLVLDLYREQLLGLYVPSDAVLYVAGDDVALTAHQRVTAAHEVVHALQDRAFGLEALLDVDDREADAALAVRSLVEGDAVLVQERWAALHQTGEERSAALAEARGRTSPTLATAPPYVAESIAFPYLAGTAFVSALHEAGGQAAVDRAFTAPPTTTAQILHPERYLAGEDAVAVTFGEGPGEGWDEVRTATFGAFDLDHLLRPLGSDRAATIAEGWAGGEVRAWQRGGDDAVALVLALRDPGSAAALCDAAPRWYRTIRPGEVHDTGAALQSDEDAFAVVCTSTGVTLAVAPDVAIATALTR
jgi:hypothetical protein